MDGRMDGLEGQTLIRDKYIGDWKIYNSHDLLIWRVNRIFTSYSTASAGMITTDMLSNYPFMQITDPDG